MKAQSGLLLMCLGLAACQSSNPYVAQSRPLPPAPAQAATTFDRSAYPAPPSPAAPKTAPAIPNPRWKSAVSAAINLSFLSFRIKQSERPKA